MVLETISKIIKVQLPAYLKRLPLPETIGGFARLTGNKRAACCTVNWKGCSWVWTGKFVMLLCTFCCINVLISVNVSGGFPNFSSWMSSSRSLSHFQLPGAQALEHRCWRMLFQEPVKVHFNSTFGHQRSLLAFKCCLKIGWKRRKAEHLPCFGEHWTLIMLSPEHLSSVWMAPAAASPGHPGSSGLFDHSAVPTEEKEAAGQPD